MGRPMPDPKFKLGDRVTVAAALRRGYEFDWDAPGSVTRRPYRKVWKRIHPKRQHGIIVGKRNLSDGSSDGSRETWNRYRETRRYPAYIVAFNLSARHEYVLPEDLALDLGDGVVIATDLDRDLLGDDVADEDIVDAEIIDG